MNRRDTARAMADGYVETVREAFEVLNTRGVESLLEDFVAPDGVWYTAPEWVEGSEYHGHDGLRFLLSVWTDYFDDWSVDMIELRDTGEGSVVALIEHGGKIKGTDVPIRQPMGCVISNPHEGANGILMGRGRLLRELGGSPRSRRAVEIAALDEKVGSGGPRVARRLTESSIVSARSS